MLSPGAWVGEVEPAGTVQRLLRGATGPAAGQDRILVAVLAGQVDSEPPHGRGADVAEPAQRQHLAAAELAVDVGEPAAEADPHLGKRRPALPCAGGQPLLQGGLGRLRDRGRHATYLLPAR